MKIYYDPTAKKWLQNEVQHVLLWGKNKCEIGYSGSISNNSLPFPISFDGISLGPIIGILAGESNKKKVIGNSSTFRLLSLSLQQFGALCVVFTPSTINEKGMDGFLYVSAIKKWIKVTSPLPNVVYNRIPSRLLEKKSLYSNTFSFLDNNSIPYFNRSFFSKWETFKMLIKNPSLYDHIPKTELHTSFSNLQSMLQTYNEIYLKPSEGHKGKGIYKIILEAPTNITLLHTKESFTYDNLDRLWDKIKKQIESTPYIIQEAVKSDTFNGKRYDLRILAHYQEKDYHISGIGVRMSGNQEVTTHVPNGGRIIPFKKLADRVDKAKIASIVNSIGKQLETETGSFIGEFSVDIGKSAIDDNYYIYEVNSKPMVFDEPDIKNKGLENLSKLLIMRAKPHNH